MQTIPPFFTLTDEFFDMCIDEDEVRPILGDIVFSLVSFNVAQDGIEIVGQCVGPTPTTITVTLDRLSYIQPYESGSQYASLPTGD